MNRHKLNIILLFLILIAFFLPTYAQLDPEATPEATEIVILDNISDGETTDDLIDPDVGIQDRLLSTLELTFSILQNITIGMIVGFVFVIVIIALKDGTVTRAIANVPRSPQLVTPLEYLYDKSNDVIQMGIEFAGSTSQYITDQLKERHADDKIIITAGAITQFLKEISDGVPLTMKDLSDVPNQETPEGTDSPT